MLQTQHLYSGLSTVLSLNRGHRLFIAGGDARVIGGGIGADTSAGASTGTGAGVGANNGVAVGAGLGAGAGAGVGAESDVGATSTVAVLAGISAVVGAGIMIDGAVSAGVAPTIATDHELTASRSMAVRSPLRWKNDAKYLPPSSFRMREFAPATKCRETSFAKSAWFHISLVIRCLPRFPESKCGATNRRPVLNAFQTSSSSASILTVPGSPNCAPINCRLLLVFCATGKLPAVSIASMMLLSSAGAIPSP